MNNKKRTEEVFKILDEYFQISREIELDYINPYTLLVAVVLSAQSTDKGVNKATKELFKAVKTPKEMLKLGEEKLKEYIKTIGLYNSKAKNIILLSKRLVEVYNSEVPSTMEDLTSLAGVGRKTANIILNSVYHIPSIAVDTHVFRVSNRIGITSAKDVLESEKQLIKIVPSKYVSHVNHFLVLLGRYTCKAKKPECEKCPIKHLCDHNI